MTAKTTCKSQALTLASAYRKFKHMPVADQPTVIDVTIEQRVASLEDRLQTLEGTLALAVAVERS